METAIKTTPLHAWHIEQSANMAAFGGYEMPLWYPSGAKAEHLAVLTGAGSAAGHQPHGGAHSHGPSVRDLLQRLFSKDLEQCIGPKKGRCCLAAVSMECFSTRKAG